MKPETIEHVETAVRDRNLARALVRHGVGLGLEPPPYEWVVVVGFYAAVHYVNALLWERYSIKPNTHAERTGYIGSLAPLTTCRLEYRQLNNHGWSARYAPGYRLSEQLARALLDVNLARVEEVVCSRLGLTPS